jgi:hypothetical protein
MIAKIGIGWTGTFIAFLWIIFSPMLWAVRIWGPKWRAEADGCQSEIEEEEKRGEGGYGGPGSWGER